MAPFITKCAILAVILTQTSCYTFVSPTILGRSFPQTWPGIFQYPTIPAHRYDRPIQLPPIVQPYYGDSYYPRNLHNRNYYLARDSYDDSDYYSNILYYLPYERISSHYEPAVMDPMEEVTDYEDEPTEDDSISNSQRNFWLEKNTALNEDSGRQVNRVSNLYGGRSAISKTEPKLSSKSSRKIVSKERNAGVDNAGRKKGAEQEHGNYQTNARKQERPWVYGKPVHYERNDDSNVRDLKSLLKSTLPNAEDKDKKYVDSVSSWAAGNDKRSGGKTSVLETKENSAHKDKSGKTNKPTLTATKRTNVFSIYDEGGREIVPENIFLSLIHISEPTRPY